MPLTAVQVPIDPPVTVTSDAAKSVEASESVKVIVAVEPLATLDALDVMATVGAMVSTAMESVPEALSLPAVSVKAPAPTVTVALPLKLAVGVNVVVKTVPEPVRAPIVPPVTATSAAVKLPTAMASESVNVSCEVWPERTVEGAAAIVTVGATMSMVIGVARPPARFWLPLASVNEPAATETVPEVAGDDGVKTAV